MKACFSNFRSKSTRLSVTLLLIAILSFAAIGIAHADLMHIVDNLYINIPSSFEQEYMDDGIAYVDPNSTVWLYYSVVTDTIRSEDELAQMIKGLDFVSYYELLKVNNISNVHYTEIIADNQIEIGLFIQTPYHLVLIDFIREDGYASDDDIIRDILYSLAYMSPSTSDSTAKIEAFVARCYQLILSRTPDQGGLVYWRDALKSGSMTASKIIYEFTNSYEFNRRGLTNDEKVEILYKTMLDRSSDASGRAYWVGILRRNSIGTVIDGFCQSTEFLKICNQYGITPGAISIKSETVAEDRSKVEDFVSRCYNLILGRGADSSGLTYWTDSLVSGRSFAAEVVSGFVNSDEFRGRNLSASDKVEILYKTMLDRSSDSGGKAYWVGMLNAGNSINVIINGFCGSHEFITICSDYGISPGSVAVLQGLLTGLDDQENQDEFVEEYIEEDASEIEKSLLTLNEETLPDIGENNSSEIIVEAVSEIVENDSVDTVKISDAETENSNTIENVVVDDSVKTEQDISGKNEEDVSEAGEETISEGNKDEDSEEEIAIPEVKDEGASKVEEDAAEINEVVISNDGKADILEAKQDIFEKDEVIDVSKVGEKDIPEEKQDISEEKEVEAIEVEELSISEVSDDDTAEVGEDI